MNENWKVKIRYNAPKKSAIGATNPTGPQLCWDSTIPKFISILRSEVLPSCKGIAASRVAPKIAPTIHMNTIKPTYLIGNI
jgi:hypothetical protein